MQPEDFQTEKSFHLKDFVEINKFFGARTEAEDFDAVNRKALR